MQFFLFCLIEKEREEKLELKRLVDAQAAEKKRKEAADRIEANVKAARNQADEKRSELLEKQARHEEYMNEIKQSAQEAREAAAKRKAVMDTKKKCRLKKVKEEEEENKRGVRSKMEQEEERLKELAEQRAKEARLIKAEKDLQLQMKRENLDRIKRAQEYQLKVQVQKADANDKRCQQLKKRKEDLLRVRKKNAHEARVKKDRLVAMLVRILFVISSYKTS